jgi:hypothetical protein
LNLSAKQKYGFVILKEYFLEKDLHVQLRSEVVKFDRAIEINPRVIGTFGLDPYTHCVNPETKTYMLPG